MVPLLECTQLSIQFLVKLAAASFSHTLQLGVHLLVVNLLSRR